MSEQAKKVQHKNIPKWAQGPRTRRLHREEQV